MGLGAGNQDLALRHRDRVGAEVDPALGSRLPAERDDVRTGIDPLESAIAQRWVRCGSQGSSAPSGENP